LAVGQHLKRGDAINLLLLLLDVLFRSCAPAVCDAHALRAWRLLCVFT
jgi:hypothetical protein